MNLELTEYERITLLALLRRGLADNETPKGIADVLSPVVEKLDKIANPPLKAKYTDACQCSCGCTNRVAVLQGLKGKCNSCENGNCRRAGGK